MKTPNLDNEIDKLEVYKSNDILSERGEDLLKEFKEIKEQLNLSGVVKSLEIKEEIVFEDWLKQHRFTKDINDYVKNNITYREWEVFNMYTMDVYNL